MSPAFVIEQEPSGYRYRLRRSDGTVVVEGPVRASRHQCDLDVQELERLVAQAGRSQAHGELTWQARVCSP
jgi:hypothetical protein